MLLLSFCPLPNVSVSSRLPSGDEGDNFYVIDQGEVDVSGRKELSHSHRKTTTYFLSLYIWLNQIEGRGGGVQPGPRRVASRIVGKCWLSQLLTWQSFFPSMTRLRCTASMLILLLLCLCVCSIQSRVSTPMTISTRRSKARHVAEAARLRAESFVISGPDTVRQGKVGEIKTGADRELKRKWPYWPSGVAER